MMRAMNTATDYADMSRRAAEYVVRFIEAAPEAVIALPTGETPVGTYDRLIEMLASEPLDCSGLFFVNLDEFVGLPWDRPGSFGHALRETFLDRGPISKAAYRLLDGAASDLEEECARHERAIRERGGIDLAILGIGLNGHIAFNEPGTSFASRTHVATLKDSTIERLTPPEGPVPKNGLTVGIETILEARSILLLASGDEKARVLDAAFHGPPTSSNPASALQRHPNTTVIADRAALSLWKPRDAR
jgi:glucosamine-6-phosphate deaminase